jgi:hypothetical protein
VIALKSLTIEEEDNVDFAVLDIKVRITLCVARAKILLISLMSNESPK